MANAKDYDHKASVERISDDQVAPTTLEAGAGGDETRRKLEPPPLVAAMTAEVRAKAEKSLRRKIDTRLLPMIILMYIMSMFKRCSATMGCTRLMLILADYLDRNNIAAVRLAGLQDELNLSSVQYQVCATASPTPTTTVFTNTLRQLSQSSSLDTSSCKSHQIYF